MQRAREMLPLQETWDADLSDVYKHYLKISKLLWPNITFAKPHGAIMDYFIRACKIYYKDSKIWGHSHSEMIQVLDIAIKLAKLQTFT